MTLCYNDEHDSLAGLVLVAKTMSRHFYDLDNSLRLFERIEVSERDRSGRSGREISHRSA